MLWPMAEEDLKRNFSRVPWSRLVRYREEQAQEMKMAPVANLSMGGLYIRTDEALALGARLYLQFMLDSGDLVAEGWGRVVRRDGEAVKFGPGLGIEFVNMD